jgi:hypothetical protein
MSQFIQLVNGLPVMVSQAGAAFDESILYPSGLAASTTVTIPNSESFENIDASDIIITVNQKLQEVGRNFTVVGASGPFTQVQFIDALPNDSVVRFKKVL